MRNKFFVVGSDVFIKLRTYSDGKFWTIIDLSDLDLIDSFSGYWYCTKNQRNYYVFIIKDGVPLAMHRVLFNEIPNDLLPDHKNRDGLDNRRDNLRLVTHQENMINRKPNNNSKTGVAGVIYRKRSATWEAWIDINCKKIYLGSFYKKEDAIEARSKAEDAHLP